MKRIIAVIRSELEQNIIHALSDNPVVGNFTVKKVQHYGDVTSTRLHYRGRSTVRQWQESSEFSVVVHDNSADTIVNLLMQQGRLAEQGDGFIVVQDVTHVIDIKTGEVS